MTAKIMIRNVYGSETIYPACSISKALANIARTTTLTPQTLKIARQQLGIEFEIVTNVSEETKSILEEPVNFNNAQYNLPTVK